MPQKRSEKSRADTRRTTEGKANITKAEYAERSGREIQMMIGVDWHLYSRHEDAKLDDLGSEHLQAQMDDVFKYLFYSSPNSGYVSMAKYSQTRYWV